MTEKSRVEFIEVEEQPKPARPRVQATDKPRPRVQRPAGQQGAQTPSLAPPGAVFTPSEHLEPITNTTLYPGGARTEFHYLYDQIANVAAGQAGQGPMAQSLADHADTNFTNLQDGDVPTWNAAEGEWQNQQPGGGGGGASLSVANTWTALQTFCVDDTNNNVQRPVSLCHTHSGDLAAAPIGVGMAFEVELSLGGAKQTIAQIDADTTALGSTPGSETGRLLFNVTSAGTENNELALYPQQLTIPRAPLASATRARVQIGSANWHFGGAPPSGVLNHGDTSGCVLGINEPTGYAGLLLAAGVAGVPRFIINSDAEHSARIVDTSTTGPVTVLALEHRLSSGTASVGIGAALEFKQPSDTGTMRVGAKIHSETSDATNGAENVGLVFTNRVGGTDAEGGRFSGSTGHLNIINAVQALKGFHAGQNTGKAAVVDIRRSGESAPAAGDRISLRVVGPADTAVPWSADHTADVYFDLSATKQFTGGGTIASAYGLRLLPRTYAADAAQTLSDAAVLSISGPPIAGANMTITNPRSMDIVGTAKFRLGGQTHLFDLEGDASSLSGSIIGRIPILFGGSLGYIPVYPN